jgi:hypothetical protein
VLNVTRSRRASKRSLPVLEDVPCRCELYDTNPEFHEVLRDFDSYGLAGAYEVMTRLDAQRERLDADEGMSWADFPDWVADHLWEDPRSVGALARRLAEVERLRWEHGEAEEALDAALEVLRTYERKVRR